MKSRLAHRNLALAAVASFILGASSVQCGSSVSGTGTGVGSGNGGATSSAGSMGATGSANGGSTSSLSGGNGGETFFDVQVADYSAEQIYGNDPPQMVCGDSGIMPPPVMGTPTCPSDKNLPGCYCHPVGTTAACWTGLRKDRGVGVCKDGVTTCTMNSESTSVWGPCVGEVLPVAGATSGADACECFSTGFWNIANLEPCFYMEEDAMGNVTNGAISTLPVEGGAPTCPSEFTTAPAEAWSSDSLTADCAGTFTLCYTIKAGNPKSPQANDCVITQSCVTADYTTANAVQPLPDLPSWISAPSASTCVQQFQSTGGYGQMSVNGESIECEMISKVFQTVTYCGSNQTGCSPGGGGSF